MVAEEQLGPRGKRAREQARVVKAKVKVTKKSGRGEDPQDKGSRVTRAGGALRGTGSANGGDSVFTMNDEVALRAFLDKGVSAGTKRAYESRWKWWKAYVELWADEEGRPRKEEDLYMEGVSHERRERAWVQFIRFLDHSGVKDQRMKEYVSGVIFNSL